MTVPNVSPGARSGFGEALNGEDAFEPEVWTDPDATPGDDTDESEEATEGEASEPEAPADENVPYDASAVGTLSGSGERTDGGE